MTSQEIEPSVFFQTRGGPDSFVEDLRDGRPVYWGPMLRGLLRHPVRRCLRGARERHPVPTPDPARGSVRRTADQRPGRHVPGWTGRSGAELAVGAILDRPPNLRLDPDAQLPEL